MHNFQNEANRCKSRRVVVVKIGSTPPHEVQYYPIILYLSSVPLLLSWKTKTTLVTDMMISICVIVKSYAEYTETTFLEESRQIEARCSIPSPFMVLSTTHAVELRGLQLSTGAGGFYRPPGFDSCSFAFRKSGRTHR